MSVFQHTVSLHMLYDGGSEAIERPQFFTESHQKELLTLEETWRSCKASTSKSWPAGSLCSTGATGLVEPIPTVQTCNIGYSCS